MIRCKIIYYDKTRSDDEYILSVPLLKNLEVSNLPSIMISELVYQDLPPDADEYEETSIKIKNSKVLIMEDVITTGKSSLECSKLVESNKGITVGYACIIDRSNGKSAIKKK